MEKKLKVAFSYVLILSYISNFHTTNAQDVDESRLETYIVHVSLPENQVLSEPQDLTEYYRSFLPKTNSLALDGPLSLLVYPYKPPVLQLSSHLHMSNPWRKRVDSCLLGQNRPLLFTQLIPQNFLGLHQNLGFWKDSNYGKGVIIGVLDTGITPGHPSFNDEGVLPPPKKWKGKCEFANKTLCNNKLIGARSFGTGTIQPLLDWAGHGTHTSSIAAGNFVKGTLVLTKKFCSVSTDYKISTC